MVRVKSWSWSWSWNKKSRLGLDQKVLVLVLVLKNIEVLVLVLILTKSLIYITGPRTLRRQSWGPGFLPAFVCVSVCFSVQYLNKYIRPSSHMPILSYVHTPRDFTNGASLAWCLRRRSSTVMFTCGWEWPTRLPIRPSLGFCGAKFTKMCDSLPLTPMNRREKFDAASFIIGGEIRNHTNAHTHTHTHKQTNKQTNRKRYIYTLPIGMCG